jgi:hypothetical protein
VQEYIDDVRPVTVEEVEVVLPAMPAADGVAIRARLTAAQAKFDWDFDDTGWAGVAVTGWAPGPPAKLLVASAVPQSLLDAVAAGEEPRIQVLRGTGVSVDLPVVPVAARVTAVDIAGTDLTLDELPDEFLGDAATPIGGLVYAGGPIQAPVAAAIQAAVDELGPARGEHADPSDVWEDSLTVARVTGAAFAQLDADGLTRLVGNVVSGGITFDGAPIDKLSRSTVDGEDGPEILYAESILVSQ